MIGIIHVANTRRNRNTPGQWSPKFESLGDFMKVRKNSFWLVVSIALAVLVIPILVLCLVCNERIGLLHYCPDCIYRLFYCVGI